DMGRLYLADEDIADPLGLGLESYRAVAWELGNLCEQIVDRVFGPAASPDPAPAEQDTGGHDERRTAMREYAADCEALKSTDPEVARAVADELHRERTTLRLIASENYTSPAVLAALGSTM